MIQKNKSNKFIRQTTVKEKPGGLQTKVPLKTQSDFVLRTNYKYHKSHAGSLRQKERIFRALRNKVLVQCSE